MSFMNNPLAFYHQGNVPSEIGTMSSLEFLNLEMNELEGAVPTSIGDLGNLKVSHLHHFLCLPTILNRN